MSDAKEVKSSLPESEIQAMILVNVEKILKHQNGTKKWGTQEHNALLCFTAMDCGMEKEQAEEFVQFLSFNGLGGNASQFRQAKFMKGRLPKTEKQQINDYLSQVD